MSLVNKVYKGSNAAATRKFCTELARRGQIGQIAAALFRAQKSSSRAKKYRGGIEREGRTIPYRELAYTHKGKSLERLANLLAQDDCGMIWGWGLDGKQSGPEHVIYIDLPQGQVSFHSTQRFAGPDYPGKWDGKRASESRILEFCDQVWRGCADEQTRVARLATEVKEPPDGK